MFGMSSVFIACLAAPVATAQGLNAATAVKRASAPVAADTLDPIWIRVAQWTIHERVPLPRGSGFEWAVDGFWKAVRAQGEWGRQVETVFQAFEIAGPWPVEVQFYVQPDKPTRIMIPIFYDGSRLDLTAALEKGNPASAKPSKKVVWKGETYQVWVLRNERPRKEFPEIEYGYFVTGRFQGRPLALLTASREPIEILENDVKDVLVELQRCDPLGRALPVSLARQRKPVGMEFVLQMNELTSSFAKSPLAAQARALVGERFDGAVLRMAFDEGRFTATGFVDLRAGSGLLGALFATSSKPGTLGGWIPRDAAEFHYARLDFANLAPHLTKAMASRVPIHPRDWGAGFGWVKGALGAADPAVVLASNLTGEIAAVSGASERVFLLGAVDGTRILRWVKAYVAEEGPMLGIAAAPLVGEGADVIALTMDGRPVYTLAARKEIVVVLESNEANWALGKRVLATSGRSPWTDGLATRLGRDAASGTGTMFSLGSLLPFPIPPRGPAASSGAPKVTVASVGPRANSKGAVENSAACAARATCGPEGLTLRVTW